MRPDLLDVQAESCIALQALVQKTWMRQKVDMIWEATLTKRSCAAHDIDLVRGMISEP